MARTLRERFAALRASVEQRAPPVVSERGKSKRLQLRVPDELLLQLAVIKLAEGGSTNKFCEGQIAEGAAKRIAELKLRFSVDTWEAIVASAHGCWREGAGD
ncbi:protein of unknown function [Candidatus Filomicrobium marinum]|uniref:Uncharacterized protein n=1 Tax=Candidatus Filomicrobium marinum TaxID=1608628 RepID=A0A0D6JAW5_9HYPH|nr:hypothetical protein [Candidatus Filomicrobium marinum]CFX04297.1 protein of unknown function [Candidatus Filomicrobium marinum]CPR16019.1 protein of unknown function [Candidatus Filomicrobium marinum]